MKVMLSCKTQQEAQLVGARIVLAKDNLRIAKTCIPYKNPPAKMKITAEVDIKEVDPKGKCIITIEADDIYKEKDKLYLSINI